MTVEQSINMILKSQQAKARSKAYTDFIIITEYSKFIGKILYFRHLLRKRRLNAPMPARIDCIRKLLYP